MNEIELLLKVAALENHITSLEQKMEKDNIQLYEYLQFMNLSQKIKDLENKVRFLESDLEKKVCSVANELKNSRLMMDRDGVGIPR